MKRKGIQVPNSIMLEGREFEGRIVIRERNLDNVARRGLIWDPSILPNIDFLPIMNKPPDYMLAKVPGPLNISPSPKVGMNDSS